MSAIFKKRKTPKHLIIRNDYDGVRPRNRFTLVKGLLWLGLFVLLTWVGITMVEYSSAVS
jgi:hypothetical protein